VPEVCGPTVFLDFGDDLLAFFGDDVRDGNAGAFRRQDLAGCLSDSPGPAGDDGDLVVQSTDEYLLGRLQ